MEIRNNPSNQLSPAFKIPAHRSSFPLLSTPSHTAKRASFQMCRLPNPASICKSTEERQTTESMSRSANHHTHTRTLTHMYTRIHTCRTINSESHEATCTHTQRHTCPPLTHGVISLSSLLLLTQSVSSVSSHSFPFFCLFLFHSCSLSLHLSLERWAGTDVRMYYFKLAASPSCALSPFHFEAMSFIGTAIFSCSFARVSSKITRSDVLRNSRSVGFDYTRILF